MQPRNYGFVFDIQRFCLHDGPGLRTVVFLKGCPLRCNWCANPESQRKTPDLLFNPELCINCGACAKACLHNAIQVAHNSSNRINRIHCKTNGNCAAVCPTSALRLAGAIQTVQSVLDEVNRDRIVYDGSGGGVTFSGGEPFAQPEFLLGLLQSSHKIGLNIAVETCGYADWSIIEECLPWINHLLFDVKHPISDRHRAGTGIDFEPIAQNLQRLSAMKIDLLVRIPVIPGFNADNITQQAFVRLFQKLNINRVELLSYHEYGIQKYDFMDRIYPGKDYNSSDSLLETVSMQTFFCKHNIDAQISGD